MDKLQTDLSFTRATKAMEDETLLHALHKRRLTRLEGLLHLLTNVMTTSKRGAEIIRDVAMLIT